MRILVTGAAGFWETAGQAPLSSRLHQYSLQCGRQAEPKPPLGADAQIVIEYCVGNLRHRRTPLERWMMCSSFSI
jgi:hypothetical protein